MVQPKVRWSTKKDGNMSLLWGDKEEVNSNRRKFLASVGLSIDDCVVMSLIHGTDIVEVGMGEKGKTIEADCLMTREKGVVLFLLTGDCFPVVLWNEDKLALVHLGYMGTGLNLVGQVAKKFEKANEIRVLIGPGIRKESYIFKQAVQKDDLMWQPFLTLLEDGRTAIDISGLIKKQLVDAGVRGENIEDCGIDTGANKDFFSHYRSVNTGETEGRFVTVASFV